MKLFRETIEFLKSGEFYGGLIERMFALVVCVGIFAALAFAFIYKPIILLYVLIAGMLVMGWFMLYFVFPELHEWIHAAKTWVTGAINRLLKR